MYSEKCFTNLKITGKLILWATTVLSAPQVIQWDTDPNHRKFEDVLSDASNDLTDVSDIYFDYNSNYAQMLRLVFIFHFIAVVHWAKYWTKYWVGSFPGWVEEAS